MNLKSLMKRAANSDKAFEKLEAELADAFDECLKLDDPPPENGQENGPGTGIIIDETLSASIDSSQPEDGTSPSESGRLTPHTQSRLAALGAVDGLFHNAQDHLEEINAKLSEISSSHNLTREFLNLLHGDVLRANELELANLGLATQQKMLTEQLHEANRKQRERDGAFDVLKQREASLVQDREELRAALAAVRLELVGAGNASAKREAEFGEIVKALTAKTVEANRRARENKQLREKHVSLAMDLDKAGKRETAARHRLDELSVIHANEAARLSELLAALGKSEKEELRLQKSVELAQTKLAEMTEVASIMEADTQAELARNQLEMSGLRSEIQNLQSRLEHASNENSAAEAEVAKLKAQWSDAVTEKQVADEKLAALMKESESDKMSLSTVNADLSQLSLQQASEQMELDVQRQECEDLRAEVAALNARVKELLPYERQHRVAAAAKPREGVVVEINGLVAEAARATNRRRQRRSLRATP